MAKEPVIAMRPEEWALGRDILRTHIPDCEVRAFGSRVTGTARRYSDLDLANIAEGGLPLGTSAALADAFSECDLPWRMDLVDWATISPEFRRIIQRNKVVVQCGGGKAGGGE